jgi:hypothetical protein
VRAIEAEDARPPGARAEEPEQRQDQRRLSRAVRAEQADRLAGTRHAEAAGDPVEDLPPPQLDLEIFEFDDRARIHCINGAWWSIV